MSDAKSNISTGPGELKQIEENRCATFERTEEQTLRVSRSGTSNIHAVCIISSSPLAAQYLMLLLQNSAELKPMIAEDFLSFADDFQDPIFVLDCAYLSLPPTECLRRLNKRFRSPKCIVIDDIQTEDDAVSSIALGVHGMVEYKNVGNLLEVAIRAVAKGRLFLSEGALEAYVKMSANPKRCRAPVGVGSTTPRETEILELVKRRLSNKEIASMLGVKESTIKFHLGNILGKLQLESRYDLRQSTKQAWETMLA